MQLKLIHELMSPELHKVKEIIRREWSNESQLIANETDLLNNRMGKLLRPCLVLMTGQIFDEITDKHRLVAAVTELIHMATLLHDDVLDEADNRRFEPTINNLKGNETAVLLGDLLITQAYMLCSRLESIKILREITRCVKDMCEGELIQMAQRGNYQLNEQEYIDIIKMKTASLIGCCCYLGALISDADEATCRKMEEIGVNYGVAFQIMDDITDVIGNDDASGKTLGTDLDKEKLTLPLIHYLSQGNGRQADWLRHYNRQRSKRDNHELIDRLNESGSIDYARNKVRDYIEQVRNQLDNKTKAGRNMLMLMEQILD